MWRTVLPNRLAPAIVLATIDLGKVMREYGGEPLTSGLQALHIVA